MPRGDEYMHQVEEDRSLELFHGRFHLMRAQMRLEAREIVDGALAVRRCDHERGVRADFARYFAPCCFDGRDRICQGSALNNSGRVWMTQVHG